MKRNTFFLFLLALSFVLSSSTFAQTVLDETFNYTVGDSLAAHTWVGHSWSATTNNTILVTSGGLTYNGFVNSGKGNSVALKPTGEDLHKSLGDSITTGAVYASFLVNVSAAQTGDYFFHFINSNIGQNIYRARVFAKKATNGGVAFGIAKGTLPVTWNDSVSTPFVFNTTYLIVVKYSFASGTGNDTISLWVNPTLNGVEPTPLVTAVDATTDLLSIANIALRQGGSASGPTLALSGIHIAKTWDLGTATASLSLSAPKGGESWLAGSSQNITWTSTGVTNVKLEVSADGGSNWSTIVASTAAAANSYAWTVPSTAGTNYKVRISDVDGKATAVTSAAFTVTTEVVRTLALTAPVAGDKLTIGASKNITWTSSNVTNVKLAYSTDAGANWTDIVASTAANAGSYAWTVPNTASATCLVKATDVDNATVTSTSGSFSIVVAGQYATIASVRSLALGTKVTISGVVISPNFHATKNSFYIYDGTAGIDVYGGTLVTTALGDSVVVTGWLLSYSGLLEVSDSVSTAVSLVVTNVSSGHTVMTPKIITVAELNANGENYEGTLVTIRNVTKTTGTWPTTASVTLTCTANGTADALSMRITKPSELIGSTEPTWPRDVTGIVTQYTTTTGGYQLTPRYLSDFVAPSAVQPESHTSTTVKGFGLAQNYPNPFNPTTTINYSLDKAGLVSLKVYNILGTEVASLVNEFKSAGNYSIPFNASNLTSGVYLYKLQVGSQSLTKKLTLMK